MKNTNYWASSTALSSWLSFIWFCLFERERHRKTVTQINKRASNHWFTLYVFTIFRGHGLRLEARHPILTCVEIAVLTAHHRMHSQNTNTRSQCWESDSGYEQHRHPKKFLAKSLCSESDLNDDNKFQTCQCVSLFCAKYKVCILIRKRNYQSKKIKHISPRCYAVLLSFKYQFKGLFMESSLCECKYQYWSYTIIALAFKANSSLWPIGISGRNYFSFHF